MAIGQLYYTSCRVGLSDAPGFQFQAASPHVDPEMMREVEAVTAYQPPRSLTSASTAEQVRAAPVNLCFLPDPRGVLAQVVFTGNDYSRRFGNYFVHALVSRQLLSDLGELLPIELWQSSCWSAEEAADQRLDELSQAPPAGPLNRTTVAAFIDHEEELRRRMLPALLTAAGQAVAERDRKVVIVAERPDQVAFWIGALSFLLPPSTAGQMSFTTYDRDPQYSRPQIIGTTPECDVDREDFEKFFLFDLVAERHSDVLVHPTAGLLADVGVRNSGELWARAHDLADRTERTFADWLPVLAAAQISWRFGAERARDLPRQVAEWLAGAAGRLEPRWVEEIGGATLACLGGEDDVLPSLTHLVTAVESKGSIGLRDRIGDAAVAELLRRARSGVLDLPSMPTLTEGARSRAGERLSELLPTTSARTGLALLAWAGRTGVTVAAEALHQFGSAVLGPAVLVEPDETAHRAALAERPALRDGVVGYLDAVAEDELERLVTALDAGLGDALKLRPLDCSSGIRRADAVLRVQRGQLDPMTALQTNLFDHAAARYRSFLVMLWPPGRRTVADTRAVLKLLTDTDVVDGEVMLEWIHTALIETSADPVEQMALANELARRPAITERLSSTANARIDLGRDIHRWMREIIAPRNRPASIADLRELATEMGRLSPDDQRLAATVLAIRLDRLPPAERTTVLVALPDVRAAYLRRTGQRLSGKDADARFAADLFIIQAALTQQSKRDWQLTAADLDSLLRATVGRWGRHRVGEVGRLLADSESAADMFRLWTTTSGRGSRWSRGPLGWISRWSVRGWSRL